MKHLLNSFFSVRLLEELVVKHRRGMRSLLLELCRELSQDYPRQIKEFRLPIEFFGLIGNVLPLETFSHWKVVGWIEDLNDLVFFVDLLHHVRKEKAGPLKREMAEQIYFHCEEHWYENSYVDELFPDGTPTGSGLRTRLVGLCRRLSRQVVQESVFLVEGLASEWVKDRKRGRWTLPVFLAPSFEKGEDGGCLYVGIDGLGIRPPLEIRRILMRKEASLRIASRGAYLCIGGQEYPVSTSPGTLKKGWGMFGPRWVWKSEKHGMGGLQLGPTLVYGGDRRPRGFEETDERCLVRLRAAVHQLDEIWPDGGRLVSLLTTRVIPLRATGVVSFSYRNRPGLSFLNMFDRNQLDLIDDLVHENGHHHFNWLLRTYRLYQGDGNQEIFYSPWRRSLRPLRGILHGAFTFSMGALLFAKMVSWSRSTSVPSGTARTSRRYRLISRDMARASYRGMEELASVSYAVEDLTGTASQRGWITPDGKKLIAGLRSVIRRASRLLKPSGREVLQPLGRRSLAKHYRMLEQADRQYRLTEAKETKTVSQSSIVRAQRSHRRNPERSRLPSCR